MTLFLISGLLILGFIFLAIYAPSHLIELLQNIIGIFQSFFAVVHNGIVSAIQWCQRRIQEIWGSAGNDTKRRLERIIGMLLLSIVFVISAASSIYLLLLTLAPLLGFSLNLSLPFSPDVFLAAIITASITVIGIVIYDLIGGTHILPLEETNLFIRNPFISRLIFYVLIALTLIIFLLTLLSLGLWRAEAMALSEQAALSSQYQSAYQASQNSASYTLYSSLRKVALVAITFLDAFVAMTAGMGFIYGLAYLLIIPLALTSFLLVLLNLPFVFFAYFFTGLINALRNLGGAIEQIRQNFSARRNSREVQGTPEQNFSGERNPQANDERQDNQSPGTSSQPQETDVPLELMEVEEESLNPLNITNNQRRDR